MKVITKDVLPIIHDILRRRYGDLEILSGQGIAKGQRVEFEDAGKRVRCVIKTSSWGRISFNRREDGSWSGLTESDRVVIVAPDAPDSDKLMVSMFDQASLKEVFEANYAAQKKAGMADEVPSWLAPFHEEDRGIRGTGDGFADKALWTEGLSPIAGEPVRLTKVTADKAASFSLPQALVALQQAAVRDLPGAAVEIRITLAA